MQKKQDEQAQLSAERVHEYEERIGELESRERLASEQLRAHLSEWSRRADESTLKDELIGDLKQQLDALLTQLDELKRAHDSLVATHAQALSAEHDKHRELLEAELARQREHTGMELSGKEVLVDELKRQLDELVTASADKDALIAHLQNAATQVASTTTTTTTDDSNNSKDLLIDELKRQLDELVTASADKEALIEQLQNSAATTTDDNDTSNSKDLLIDELKRQLDELLAGADELRRSHEAAADYLRAQIVSLEERLADAERRLDEKEARVRQLADELDDAKQTVTRLDETRVYYERLLTDQAEGFRQTMLDEEQQRLRLESSVAELTKRLEEAAAAAAASQHKDNNDNDNDNDTDDGDKSHELAQLQQANGKLEETNKYYESLLTGQSEGFKQLLANEKEQQARMSKELERLREHLVVMSDSYTKEAIQAEEREKQLRLALHDAQQAAHQQGGDLLTTNKELGERVEALAKHNKELVGERDKLSARLKHAEDALATQTKATKNLELVLERLQGDKDDQHAIELLKYQQSIKEQAQVAHAAQRDLAGVRQQLARVHAELERAATFELDAERKQEQLVQLRAQMETRDALVDSLDKRVNELQKINDSYIEKEIIKNLFIGYLKLNSAAEKRQVMKLISTMLAFTPLDMEQVEHAGETKWFNQLLLRSAKSRLSGGGKDEEILNKSFAELLIQYVDRESRPKPQFKFDLSGTPAPGDSSPPGTNKKTDASAVSGGADGAGGGGGGVGGAAGTPSSMSTSAVNFFNKRSLMESVDESALSSSDLNLINRSQTANTITGLSSPAVANSFLDQILKS